MPAPQPISQPPQPPSLSLTKLTQPCYESCAHLHMAMPNFHMQCTPGYSKGVQSVKGP
ncbi:hypothetical protein BS47DRAFT_1343425 [Hydnum rufescens UP504]|uniref:Uncharacterized protein n=2 Tax=Hydnum rufescens UP504 TaxID=1448309 RepID=A0A9P6AZ89_9AGAM|nr:hypothetical protein BS47DRAFT_1343425 [Hydnum rufescens UP504]